MTVTAVPRPDEPRPADIDTLAAQVRNGWNDGAVVVALGALAAILNRLEASERATVAYEGVLHELWSQAGSQEGEMVGASRDQLKAQLRAFCAYVEHEVEATGVTETCKSRARAHEDAAYAAFSANETLEGFLDDVRGLPRD